jgi:hypothetical protein
MEVMTTKDSVQLTINELYTRRVQVRRRPPAKNDIRITVEIPPQITAQTG